MASPPAKVSTISLLHQYGTPSIKSLFMLGDFTNLNHGSFGATPKEVIKKQQEYTCIAESHPDHWFRSTYYKLIDESRRALSLLINCNCNDIVLVENASAAVNSVLRTIQWKKGDKILILESAYNMVIEVLNFLEQYVGVEVINIKLSYPICNKYSIIDAVEETFKIHGKSSIKLCIYSHISSMPTMIEPVKELTDLSHKYGAHVFIDGAHAPGIIPIDVEDLNCEYYTGNTHKWMYTPKGTAFMYVNNKIQASSFPEPNVISSSSLHDFIGRYAYTGTRDYTGFATIPAAIDYVNEKLGGMDSISNYLHTMIVKVGTVLAAEWNTTLLVDKDMCGSMVNVILPSNREDKIKEMQKVLDEVYKIYLVYGMVIDHTKESGDKIFFIRLSAAIYLCEEDYWPLIELIPMLLNR